jgi:hypothetical protein
VSVPNREFSHPLFTEKAITQASTILLARNISYCMLLDFLPFPPLTFYISRQDTDSTTAILVGVRESILRSQLSQINVI